MPVRIAAAVAVVSLFLASAAAADADTPATLSVDGSGSVMVTPDVASLSVSVARSAARSSAALSAANLRVGAIVAAVRAAGVPRVGIQTDSIDVSGETVRVGPREHQRRVRRYTATESLSITSTTSIVGRVIDAATRAGADTIDGPGFSFSQRDRRAVRRPEPAIDGRVARERRWYGPGRDPRAGDSDEHSPRRRAGQRHGRDRLYDRPRLTVD
jgi:uncharacterized protein